MSSSDSKPNKMAIPSPLKPMSKMAKKNLYKKIANKRRRLEEEKRLSQQLSKEQRQRELPMIYRYHKELKKMNIEPSKRDAVASEISNNNRKLSPYQLATMKFKELKEKRKREKQEEIQKMKERKEAIDKYKTKKKLKNKEIFKRTRKGQPIMKGRIEMLLERVQSSVHQLN